MRMMYNVDVLPAVRRAATKAMLAPSIHNTQPWRFVVSEDGLEIHADWSRRLRTVDPRGRQLLISCGCAVYNAKVAMEGLGWSTEVEHFPNSDSPDFLALVSPVARTGVTVDQTRLDAAIEDRHTNRRRFDHRSVPDDAIAAMIGAAESQGGELFVVQTPQHRVAVAALTRLADDAENADPAYRAELRAWTTSDPERADGVPQYAIPHVTGRSGDEVPMRDFDQRGTGWLPTETESRMDQCLVLLGTSGNDPWSWIRAGEALEAVLLELTSHGLVASPFTQLIEVRRTNELLREALGLEMFPHILLRVGYAEPTPATRRRLQVDVVSDHLG